jgi:hypothetical protein
MSMRTFGAGLALLALISVSGCKSHTSSYCGPTCPPPVVTQRPACPTCATPAVVASPQPCCNGTMGQIPPPPPVP